MRKTVREILPPGVAGQLPPAALPALLVLPALFLPLSACSDPTGPRDAEGFWRSVRAGGGFSCGLSTTGEAFFWGARSAGRLGDGTTSDRPTPTAVGGWLPPAPLLAFLGAFLFLPGCSDDPTGPEEAEGPWLVYGPRGRNVCGLTTGRRATTARRRSLRSLPGSGAPAPSREPFAETSPSTGP